MKRIKDYNPKNPTEAFLILYCKRQCSFSQQTFFSMKDLDGDIWHFSGHEYFCLKNKDLLKRKNLFEISERVDFEKIK